MYLSNIFSILPLVASVCSAVPYNNKRTITTAVELYAYGTNISGIPLSYGNTDGNFFSCIQDGL
jgi:hypothetical protein